MLERNFAAEYYYFYFIERSIGCFAASQIQR